MKKGRIFYIIFCVSVIVALAVFLVVKSQFEKPADQETPTTEYAQSLSLECADSYTITVGSKLHFHDYISVNPSKFYYSITRMVLLNDIQYAHNIFASNTFAPTEIGNYKIQFSLPKSETENFIEEINITVVNLEDFESLKINKTTFEIDDEIAFEDLFNVSLPYASKTVETNGNLKFENDKFVALSCGTGTIKITFATTYCNYEFNFDVEIVEKSPIYEISVVNIFRDPVKPFCYIDYTVSGEHSSTLVDVQLSNGNATFESVMDGRIKLKIINEGSVDVTIKSQTYENVSTTINIDFNTL